MTLSEYIDELLLEAERFRQYWAAGTARDPEMFPGDMDGGEWDEQFRCWLGSKQPSSPWESVGGEDV